MQQLIPQITFSRHVFRYNYIIIKGKVNKKVVMVMLPGHLLDNDTIYIETRVGKKLK